MASSGTAQCLVEDDLEERYNRLKRKYSALLEVCAVLRHSHLDLYLCL
jgi:hypothetical protein